MQPTTVERWETITVERHSRWLLITLDRPNAANAINARMAQELLAVLGEIDRDETVHCVVLTGAGTRFCAGGDLKAGFAELPRTLDNPIIAMCDALEQLSVPVIAAINGPALGGGLELALACDLRVMSSAASVGLPEIRFGELPIAGGTQRLPRIVGPTLAGEMVLTGLPVDAHTARAAGLVNEVVAPDDLVRASSDLARVLADRPRYALVAAKRILRDGADRPLAGALVDAAQAIIDMGTQEQRDRSRELAANTDPVYARVLTDVSPAVSHDGPETPSS